MQKSSNKITKSILNWRPSLLYVTFLMCGLVLLMRVSQITAVIISGDESFLEASLFSQASAADKLDNTAKNKPQTAKNKPQTAKQAPPEESKKKENTSTEPSSTKTPQKKADQSPANNLSTEVNKADKGELEPPKETVLNEGFDPFNLSEGEVKLLFTLDKKRKELEMREQDILESKKQLQVIEKRVEQKIEELKNIKGAIQKIVQQEDEQVSKNTQRLVAIYQGMKPKSAAKVFDDLPMSVLKKVVQKMDQKKVSPIMAAMDIKKVKKLTTLLAQPSPLDLPQKKLEEPVKEAAEPAADADKAKEAATQ